MRLRRISLTLECAGDALFYTIVDPKQTRFTSYEVGSAPLGHLKRATVDWRRPYMMGSISPVCEEVRRGRARTRVSGPPPTSFTYSSARGGPGAKVQGRRGRSPCEQPGPRIESSVQVAPRAGSRRGPRNKLLGRRGRSPCEQPGPKIESSVRAAPRSLSQREPRNKIPGQKRPLTV